MLKTFRVKAGESVCQTIGIILASFFLIQWTSRFEFTVPGTGEPTKYGGRDADPEKPIVMGKCRPWGCGSTVGEALEWQRYIDFIGWCSRYRMSMAKTDLLGEGSSSICRKACLTLMLVCEDLGSSQIPEVFQSYKETTQHQKFFLNTNATASFFIFKECLQYFYTISQSISSCDALTSNDLEGMNTYIYICYLM